MAYIHAAESVWFSTNVAAVLGEIWFPSITSRDSQGITFRMSIYENDKDDIFLTRKKCLQTRSVTLTKTVLNFPLPEKVLINPKKLYEICLESSAINGCSHSCQWRSHIEEDNFKVKFHRSPRVVDKDKKRHGLIHSLLFNRYVWPKKDEQLNGQRAKSI